MTHEDEDLIQSYSQSLSELIPKISISRAIIYSPELSDGAFRTYIVLLACSKNQKAQVGFESLLEHRFGSNIKGRRTLFNHLHELEKLELIQRIRGYHVPCCYKLLPVMRDKIEKILFKELSIE